VIWAACKRWLLACLLLASAAAFFFFWVGCDGGLRFMTRCDPCDSTRSVRLWGHTPPFSCPMQPRSHCPKEQPLPANLQHFVRATHQDEPQIEWSWGGRQRQEEEAAARGGG